MSNPLDWELIQEAEKRAEREILDEIAVLTSRLVGSNGETFGTEHMSREDRMLAFVDDWNSGAVQNLYVIKPEFAAAYVRQYQKDIATSPVMSGHVPDIEDAPVAWDQPEMAEAY